MNNEEYGKTLKKKAKSKGNFVSVNINNTYNLMEILSVFFYRKHHEWVAISFINENYKCTKIWFNKGPDHTQVSLGLTPEEIVRYSNKFNTEFIIISHNHPASSKMTPNYNSRSRNIQANKRLQREIFDFSNQDVNSANHYNSFFHKANLKYADAIFVAGNYKITGHEDIINNYESYNYRNYNYKKNNVSKGCLTNVIIFLPILLFLIF